VHQLVNKKSFLNIKIHGMHVKKQNIFCISQLPVSATSS